MRQRTQARAASSAPRRGEATWLGYLRPLWRKASHADVQFDRSVRAGPRLARRALICGTRTWWPQNRQISAVLGLISPRSVSAIDLAQISANRRRNTTTCVVFRSRPVASTMPRWLYPQDGLISHKPTFGRAGWQRNRLHSTLFRCHEDAPRLRTTGSNPAPASSPTALSPAK